MSISVRTAPGLNHARRAELRRLTRWIRKNVLSYHVHDLRIRAVFSDRVSVESDPKRRLLWGVLVYPTEPAAHRLGPLKLTIYLAAADPKLDPAELGVNLLHEVVHYEQWRDGRPLTERGVESRARALHRRYLRET